MHNKSILTGLGFILVMAIPACQGQFESLGKDDGGVGASSSIGGGSGVTCQYNGVNYAPGTSFKSSDGCNTCSCTSSGQVGCTAMACAVGGASNLGGGSSVNGGASGGGCVYNGVTYGDGTSFKSADGCNSCSCSKGSVLCTMMACAVGGATAIGGASSTSCGPINLPAIMCTGYKLTYDATTGCATGFTCPQDAGACTCTGAKPQYLIQCSDGSTVGPVCETDSSGACNWATPSCPTAGTGGTGAVGSTSKTCDLNGVTYQLGETFTDIGCKLCTCTDSGSFTCAPATNCGVGGASGAGGSTGKTCVYSGANYAVGTTFKSTDGCNSCTCTDSGAIACTTMACAVGGATGVGGTSVCAGIALPATLCTGYKLTTDPSSGCVTGFTCPECTCTGPSPSSPTVLCSDGSTGGPICDQLSDGTCKWAVRACPEDAGTCTCTGAKPNYLIQCSDGSIVGPECATETTGSCNWVSPSCPNTGAGGASSIGGASSVGGNTSCVYIPLAMPQCQTGYSATMQYDSAGCPKEYVCVANA